MRNFFTGTCSLADYIILMGVKLMTMSKHPLLSQVEKRMLDVSKAAAKGVPSVDKEQHADEWGRFYSA